MRLKKLSIIGFKSFADKVTIDFDCDIIGVVGPNGCGKSNIVDAFRWVMGEQSAKSLRGEKMHDVLFAGTDKRGSLGFAEVSVTLSDIGEALPTPYNEITITRRLHRSGESEYLLNKQPARLRDIQGLFLGSGIGKNAFSIFEQGKLDQIIHLNPIERRVIFDEAAGTSRFLQRKKETIRKLTTVTENYNRVHDVHVEIEKQTKQLKRQASHAKNYQENKANLNELEKKVLIYRLQNIHTKNHELETKLQILNATIQEKQSEVSNAEKQLEETKEKLLSEELSVKEQQKSYNLLETKTRVQEAEIKQQKQRLIESKNREENVEKYLVELKKELKEKQHENQKNESDLVALDISKEQHYKAFFQQKESHQLIENQLVALRGSLKAKQTDHLNLLKEERHLNAQYQERKIRYEADLVRLNSLQKIEKEQLATVEELKRQIEKQQNKVNQLSSEIDIYKAKLNAIEEKIRILRMKSSETQQKQQATLRSFTEAEARQKALSRLQEEGFSSGAKVLLKESKDKKSILYEKIKPLFEYLIPNKGYEHLMSSSMRAYEKTLVVETEEDFQKLLKFAKAKKISDFSVMIKQTVSEKKGKPKKNCLSMHVQKHPIAYHFTDTIEIIEASDFYDHFDVFFCSSAEKKQSTTFEREAEIKTLSGETERLKKNQIDLDKETSEIQKNLKKAEENRNEILEERRKKEMDLVQENFTLQRALSDLDKCSKEVACLEEEKGRLACLKEEAKTLADLDHLWHEKKEQGTTLLASLHDQEFLLEKEEQALNQSKEHLQKANHLALSAKEEWQKLHHQIKIFEAKLQQSVSHEKKLVEEISELKRRVQTIFKSITDQERQAEIDLNHLRTLKQVVKECDEKLQSTKRLCGVSEKELLLLRKEGGRLEKEKYSFEIVLAEDTSEKKALEHELLEKHSLHPNEIKNLQITLENSLEESEQQIRSLRASLEKAGAVNMTAIEEFQEKKERFDYLDQQMKDLDESKKDLEKIITTLDKESRKIFKKTFSEIRTNFQKNFEILFKGGSADLTFTDSSDILEAGIEIVAKPPGKQMRAISLLSGGEKCLTAIALLFSIFEVKPAPFCILDEVDAPLDDSNIDRFTHVLQQFIEKTQFIIVTHNKKTMAIADLLIGVSMEEKGVSKLISLAFERTNHPHLPLLKEF